MQQIKIHSQGPMVSRLIAGAWRWNSVSVSEVDRLINTSVDLGITTFDHADIYGDYSNEKIFGDAVRGQPHLAQKMQLVTKCGIKLLSVKKPEHRIKHYDTSKEHIIRSAENSLKLLHVDRIDLLLIHRPDPLMNVEEISRAFTSLKEQGKVLHFGVSNFTPAQFDLLQNALPFPLVTNQIEISLFHYTPLFDGSLDHLYKLKTSAMAWSPLGGGKTFVAEDETSRQVKNGLNRLSAKYSGATSTQLLLSWLLRHPSVIVPVIGTTKPSRMEEAAKALDIQLERQDWFEMLMWASGRDVP